MCKSWLGIELKHRARGVATGSVGLNSRDKQKQIIKMIPLMGQLEDHVRERLGDC